MGKVQIRDGFSDSGALGKVQGGGPQNHQEEGAENVHCAPATQLIVPQPLP